LTFNVAAESYDRFMGRYSMQLSPQMADLAAVGRGQRVLDVGCGPGALTEELVRRVGADMVAAVDPSTSFVAANRLRHPGVDVRQAAAEDLPFADGSFDAALAQLVVHFMIDPLAGLREMRRVTRSGGAVVASVWDYAGGNNPIDPFWRAAHDLDADLVDESLRAGARDGHLVQLFGEAGITDVEQKVLSATVRHETFDTWWEPFTLGVGPAGEYLDRLDADGRARLQSLCHERLGDGPFEITGRAWAAVGRA
jgi:ubiquinone/menaquinone biosynthesis C-methylase UbiE